MSVANCPNCGGPVEFAIGSSAVVICTYCRSVVARTDRGLEAHGVVAALIDTGTPLRTGLAGKYRGNGFRITGRTQMRHEAGGIWNEWYAAFDDGRWGWVAEAQGRYYVTFRVGDDAPPLDAIDLGARVGDLTVAEIGRAEVVSAEGELPWKPAPGETYAYADLTGPEQRFATIDYSEEAPVLFKGAEATLAELGLEEVVMRRGRVTATALNCANCGGPLDLKVPEQAERIYCPNCGSGHDLTAGKLQYLGAAKKKKKVVPVVPLGARGTIDGDEYVVAGFMERAVHFDRDYFWTEYLLHNPQKGYRWLVHSDDHWSFVTPLRPGEVGDWSPTGVAKSIHYNGKNFKLFQDATARVTYVLGEFYWKVAVGEKADTADYIAPPFGISKEVTQSGAREINYSHSRYMTRREVQEAFDLKRDLPRPAGIGPTQPFPGPNLIGPFVVLLALLLVTTVVLQMSKSHRTLLDQTYDVSALPAGEEPGRVFFTDPFEVSGRDNVMVEASANVDNEWLYVEGDLVNTLTNTYSEFAMPIEYYHGVDQGESWSEGDRDKRIFFSRPEKGSYALRIGVQWQDGRTPPSLRLTVVEGVFRWPYLIVAFLLVGVPGILALLRFINWEKERWKDSAHSPYSALESDDDDEE